jgi:Spy/CpxP family protein refolding chaperone
MSSRLTQILLGLSLLLNCFVLAGFVYRSWIEPPRFSHAGPPPRGGPLEMLSEDLKLDESQRQALHGLFERYASARHERFSEMQKIRESMTTELKKPEFDLPQIDSLVDQMTKLRAEQQKENMASIADLSSKLRPEQREQLHTILVDRFGGHGPHRERGPDTGQSHPPR